MTMKVKYQGVWLIYCILCLTLWGTIRGYAQNIDEQKKLVIELMTQKKWQVAIDTLNAMRLQRLEDPELYYLLGQANLELKDFKNAEVAFKMALYFKKAYPEANYQLGLVKLKQDLPGDAIYFFDQALKYKADFEEAKRKLGEAYFLVNKFQSALDIFNVLVKTNEKDYIAYYFVGQIRYHQDLLDAAVWNLEQCLAIFPDYFPALKLIAQIYLESNREFDALPYLYNIFSLAPDSLKDRQQVSQLLYERGKILFQKNELVEAVQDFEKALILNPKNGDARLLLEEIQRKDNYDSLMTQALVAFEQDSFSTAQTLFSKAAILAKSMGEQSSANTYLDSVTTVLNQQKFRMELNNLYAQAEGAFSRGDYDLALELYQKILLLNPSDQTSETALKESGSLKYFIQAINEWNDENWEAAQKSFEKVISYYPNFPKVATKHWALKQIERIEAQQSIVHTAIDNQLASTAKHLFQKIFQLDPENPKLYETWFQITNLAARLRANGWIQILPYSLGGLLLLILILVCIFPRGRIGVKRRIQLLVILALFILPIASIVVAYLLLHQIQVPTEAQFEIATGHASFILEEKHEFETMLISDSVNIGDINQLDLHKIQMLNQPVFVPEESTNQFALKADTLNEPLALQFDDVQEPIRFSRCCFNSPTKVVFRPKNAESYLIFSPQKFNENQANWCEGVIVLSDSFNIKLPPKMTALNDTAKKAKNLIPTQLAGMPLDASSQAHFRVFGPTFQIAFKQPNQLQFNQLPIKALSVMRFFPGDGIVKTINTLESAQISFLGADEKLKQITTTNRFYAFPNRFWLEQAKNEQGFLKLVLKGTFENIQIWHDKRRSEELIPNYFDWTLTKWPWLMLSLVAFGLILMITSVVLFIKFLRKPLKSTLAVNLDQPLDLALPAEELLNPIHKKWRQNLSEIVIPQWEKRVEELENEIKNEKNRRRRKELIQLLNRTKNLLKERVNELNAKASGENHGKS